MLSYVDDKDGEKKQVSVPREWRAAVSHLLSSFYSVACVMLSVTQCVTRTGEHSTPERK